MAGRSLTLRPASPADRELLYAIYASTRLEELAPAGWPPAELDAFLRSQFDAQDRFYHQYYPNAAYHIIELDGESIGRLYTARSDAEIRVMDIALLPPYRGRGLGTMLLRRICDEADAARIPVTIHVERDNPARHLYHRLGFTLAEDRGVYLYLVRAHP